MIVRETTDHFICIEQDYHAHLAEQIISQWKQTFLKEDPFAETVLYAIQQHDLGWHYFDKQPLWNDETNKPYTFIDLPLLIKTVLYTYGVDLVERRSPYAAALCSAHYTKFLQKYDIEEVQQYITQEQRRRERILQAFPEIDTETFEKHLGLLQFADNLSLFICLHEEGNNETRHRYFERGVRIPPAIDQGDVQFVTADWLDDTTIQLQHLPTVAPFSITMKETFLPKNAIEKEGFAKLYEKTAATKRTIHFTTTD